MTCIDECQRAVHPWCETPLLLQSWNVPCTVPQTPGSCCHLPIALALCSWRSTAPCWAWACMLCTTSPGSGIPPTSGGTGRATHPRENISALLAQSACHAALLLTCIHGCDTVTGWSQVWLAICSLQGVKGGWSAFQCLHLQQAALHCMGTLTPGSCAIADLQLPEGSNDTCSSGCRAPLCEA